MSESVKSVTSLVLLVVATTLFAAGWNSDARAQQRIAAEMARGGVRSLPASPDSAPAPPPQTSRQRSVTMEVDPSPLARLSPGRYRMVDAVGRTAWISVAPTYGSGLPPRSRVTLLNIDGLSMVLIRDEAAVAADPTAQAAR